MKLNNEKLLERFLELVQVDSETGSEEKMYQHLIATFTKWNLPYKKIGKENEDRDFGNLYVELAGKMDGPTILFNAHMDTVTPGVNKEAQVIDGLVKSAGQTILGADDFAGIAIILEIIDRLRQVPEEHSNMAFLFTVGEESGLNGSRQLVEGEIEADFAFVLDDQGPAGHYTCQAPTHDKYQIEIKGKPAHSGVEPEKGVSSVSILAEALHTYPIGRINQNATYNIGIVHGGQAMNIVCPKLEIVGEARATTVEQLNEVTSTVQASFENAAEKFGGEVLFSSTRLYYPINVTDDSPHFLCLRKAADAIALPLVPCTSGGGTDASVLVGLGIPSIPLAIGYYKMHTTEEYLVIEEFYKAFELAWSIIKTSAK